MSGILRWEEPPPYGDGRKRRGPRRAEFWREVARQLQENPGRWAVVLENEEWNYAGGMAGQIKRGTLIAFRPAGSFDAIHRTTGATVRVYARYVGEVPDAG